MAEAENVLDLNRTDVMWILHAEGKSRVEMIQPLIQLGLLVCQETHRKRPAWGGEVCESCEMTLAQTWRRHLALIGATREDADEVRGKWLHAHETIAEICMRRYFEDVEVVTIRTEGDATITTTRHEKKIHVALLRLYLDVRDKVARVGGLNIDKAIPRDMTRRRLLAPREVPQNGDTEPTN